MRVILAEEESTPRPVRGHDEGALAIMAFRQVTVWGRVGYNRNCSVRPYFP